MALIEIDENLFKSIELMLKFSKVFHGDFKRQIMKQPGTKRTKSSVFEPNVVPTTRTTTTKHLHLT